MGQIEKYGLYVLCLVIFLILGVAIFGGDPQPAHAGTGGGALPLVGTGNGTGGGSGTPARSQEGGTGGAAGTDIGSAIASLSGGRTGSEAPLPGGPGNQGRQPEPAPTPTPDTTRGRHTIQKDDVLERIAEQKLGSRAHVAAILRVNPDLDPRKLQIGKEIVLPSKADLAAGAPPAPAPKDTPTPKPAAGDGWVWYTVQKNDTYEGISRKLFKDVRHVDDIKRLNPDQNPLRIRPGMELKVPAR